MDPLTSINHVYSLVIQEESNRKNLMQIEDNSILVNVAQRLDFNHKENFHKSSNRVCTFFHHNSHTIDFCYKKYRHPNDDRNKPYVNKTHMDNTKPRQQVDEIEVASSVKHQYSYFSNSI